MGEKPDWFARTMMVILLAILGWAVWEKEIDRRTIARLEAERDSLKHPSFEKVDIFLNPFDSRTDLAIGIVSTLIDSVIYWDWSGRRYSTLGTPPDFIFARPGKHSGIYLVPNQWPPDTPKHKPMKRGSE